MIANRMYIAHHGQYALILALLCAFLVFQLGIFEGLLIAMAIHGIVNYIVLN
ncbi:hypothetical protein SAMN05421755_101519 [Nitrosomonas sp. Nm33]|nr:hypothetical protein SAMN05421755_101519 [Nitrosomonas sp. Nm33]